MIKQVNFRLELGELELLHKAAKIDRRPLGTFIRVAALEKAEQILKKDPSFEGNKGIDSL